MPKQKSRIPSPARSLGAPVTPRRYKSRGTRSVGSPASSTSSAQPSNLLNELKENNMSSFAVSPQMTSFLTDNTEVDIHRQKSWWKKIDNSRDMVEVLANEKQNNTGNVLAELDIEFSSQENLSIAVDSIPEISDGESIASIVIPPRKLFTLKDNAPQNVIVQANVSSKHNATEFEKTINVGAKNLFGKASARPVPVFPSALLNITTEKTLVAADSTVRRKVLIGSGPEPKKMRFSNFFVSDNDEDEISDIQPKVFGFQNRPVPIQRSSTASRGRKGSPTSSITSDADITEEWKQLPSSTMLDHQIEDNIATPKGSRLNQAKVINTSSTKESNQSLSSKNRSKSNSPSKDVQVNTSITTRNKSRISTPREADKSIVKNALTITSKDKLDETTIIQANSTLNKKKKLNSSNNKSDAQVINTSVETAKETSDAKNKTYAKNLTYRLSKSQNNQKSVIEDEKANENEDNIKLIAESEVVLVHQDEEEIASLRYDDEDEKNDAREPFSKSHQVEEVNDDIVLDENNDVMVSNNQLKQSDLDQAEASQEIKCQVVENELELNDDEKTTNNQKRDQVDKKDVSQVIQKEDDHENDGPELHGKKDTEINMISKLQEKVKERDESKNLQKENKRAEMLAVIKDHDENEKLQNSDEENEFLEYQEQEVLETDEDENENMQEGDNEGAENSEMEEEHEEEEISQQIEEVDKDQDMLEDVSQEAQNDGEQSENQEINDESDEVNNTQHEEEEQESDKENINEDDVDQDDSQEVEDDAINREENNEEAENSLMRDENEEEEINQEIEEEDEDVDMQEGQEDQNDDEQNENQNTYDEEAEQNESQEVNDEQEDEEQESDVEKANEDDSQEAEDDAIDASDDEAINDSDNETSNAGGGESSIANDDEAEERDNGQKSLPELLETEINVTHDTTGRRRNKRETFTSEVVLLGASVTTDSFVAKGRNTSIRKTKSILNNSIVRQSSEPLRESTGLSDGINNSSAAGSGWDSHRTTRKTLRQTFGKDFTPRKSLRTLVMEKSAKTVAINEANANLRLHQANSSELDHDIMDNRDSIGPDSDHEVSLRTKQAKMEEHRKRVERVKRENMEYDKKMKELVRNQQNSNRVRVDYLNFSVPTKSEIRRMNNTIIKKAPKVKRVKSSIQGLENVPPELFEDMKYRPPKRFAPRNASWCTKRLYKFLEDKLEPKYDYRARVRAEELVQTLYNFVQDTKKMKIAPPHAVDQLKKEMARLKIVTTHFEFYNFFGEYLPIEVKHKVVPDVINDIPVPDNLFGPIIF